MKYLHLGKDTSIEIKNIVGIFDLDTTTVSKHTRKFLAEAELQNRVVSVSMDLPKSFILYDFDGEYSIYLSPMAPATLLKRMETEDG